MKQNDLFFKGNKRLGWKQGGTVFCTSPTSFSICLSAHWNPICYLLNLREEFWVSILLINILLKIKLVDTKWKSQPVSLRAAVQSSGVNSVFSLPLYSGHSLTQFVRHCADHFLNSEHKEIRMEAARTCSRLLTPSVHLISGHAHVVSQTAVQVVADVLSKLLVVGITDPGKV